MRLFDLAGTWFRRRLAWRLCFLFIAGALLPVALSDWLVIAVMDGLAEKLDADRRAESVRAISRQVLDRVQLAEMVLQSLADARGNAPVSSSPVFDELWCPQSSSPAGLPVASDPDLAEAWRLSARGGQKGTRQLALSAGDPARVVLETVSASGRPCVGRPAAGFLWEPLRNGADDGVWSVRTASGRVLAEAHGADVDDRVARSANLQVHSTVLFLGSEGAAENWIFVQSTPRAHVDWHQQPVLAWLLAVAFATLLTVGLIGQSRIRHALAPLQRLTHGTRRLTRGDTSARVDIRQDDELGELAIAFNDMATRLEEREKQLYFRAVHDDLTGLTNRYGLHQELQALLVDRERPREIALLFIDLDRFKDVNDRHGHATGDEVLKEVARRLRSIARDDLLVARNGGDEFVIAIPAAGAESRAREVAASVVASLSRPFELPAGHHTGGASIGIALCPAHAAGMLELLRCADIALYESKRAGRGRFTVFDSAIDIDLRHRHDLLVALRQGLDHEDMVVHFQPRIRVEDGAIESAEALVRWNRRGHGLVFPDAFVALAESSGLIVALGLQVLDATLGQLAQWRRNGIWLQRISVNVSPRQFEAGNLVAQVRSALQAHDIPPSFLELEVTESLLSGDVADVSQQLVELRQMGVTIAMDDFGTGYSSMALLRKLPIDVMKIDRAFVRDLESDANAVAIAQTIVTLGRSLSLRLVAEGVETPGQAELLRAMGCDELQGYLFGKPMPADQFALLAGLRPAQSQRALDDAGRFGSSLGVGTDDMSGRRDG